MSEVFGTLSTLLMPHRTISDSLDGNRLEDPEAGDYTVKPDPASSTIRILPAEPGVLPSPIYPGLRTNLPKVRPPSSTPSEGVC